MRGGRTGTAWSRRSTPGEPTRPSRPLLDGRQQLSAPESCHEQPLGSLITRSAQVAVANIKSRHLCVLIDIWTTTR